MRVSDDSVFAAVLLFDRDVYDIVDKSAYILKEAETNNATDQRHCYSELMSVGTT